MDDETLEPLLTGSPENGNATIHQCVQPLAEVGDLKQPVVRMVSDALGIIPGDLALSSFEDRLSMEWPNALGSRRFVATVPVADRVLAGDADGRERDAGGHDPG